MTRKAFFLAALLVTLFVAGGVSFYASSHPDGLEFVAEKTGFLDSADEHAAGDGPMADYSVKGVGNERAAGGLAGVAGVAITLLFAGGLAYAVRRRDPHTDAASDPASDPR
ncbi:MAG: PDGLE domain-containing protein [Nocardioides sp.]|jgi:cobalt/nickel transport protein